MAAYKLIPYLIKIKKPAKGRKKSEDDYYDLDNIQGIDLFDCLLQNLNVLLPGTRIATLPKFCETLTVSSLNSDKKDRTIYGTIQCGEYGLELDGIDMNTGKFIQSFRKTSIAELIPYFFMFHLNAKYKKYGLLILQTFRNYGIKSIFSYFLREYVPNCIKGNPGSEIGMEMIPILKKDVVEKLDKGRILQFRLIRHDLPKNCGDKYMLGQPHEIIEERVFKVKRTKSLRLRMNDLKKLLGNLETDFYTIDGIDYDEIKFIIENENQKRETFSTTKKEVKIKEFREISFSESDLDKDQTAEDIMLNEAKEYIEILNSRAYYE